MSLSEPGSINKGSISSSMLQDQLAQTELLRGVPEAFLRLLIQDTSLRELEAGEMLLTPERDNYHVYLLLSGALTVHFVSPDSPEIRVVTPGFSVGELSVIDGCRPTAYVVAREASRVFAVARDRVLGLIGGSCPLSLNLLTIMTHLIKSNTECIVQSRAQIDTLTSHANLDGLTGLYNRRWLVHSLPRLMETGHPLCVLVLDVDHFKRYNDGHGHPAGDLALKALSQVLKNTVRPYDFVIRYGGEEFLALLPSTPREEGLKIAERIRHNTEIQAITQSGGDPLPGITLSIGLAMNAPGLTPEALIQLADAQLYQAKQSGRNRVCD
jgi:diguanylate cyclase (GGDEF)-like protein